MDPKEEIRRRIEAAIESSGLQKKRLALDAGKAERTLRDWRQGKSLPKAHHLRELCLALGVSADDLLDLPMRIPEGRWLCDVERLEQILATTEPKELKALMIWIPIPVRVGLQIPHGARWASEEEVWALTHKAIDHIEEHAPDLFEEWRDDLGRR